MNADSHLFIIFGATGDLTRRKLFPAIYRMMHEGLGSSVVLGVATTPWDDEQFRAAAAESLEEADVTGTDSWCSEQVYFEPIEPTDSYDAVAARIREIEQSHGLSGNRIFYLAVPPHVFPSAIERLVAAGLDTSEGWTRLVIEKPFGHDAASAHNLNDLIHGSFDESQVFRIDHYLGKDTVQNLLVFRFTNPLFEGAWNRDRVERVEITVAESVDVASRGEYYDAAGAVRDMIQNHLTQVMTLIAMEAPTSMDADDIRSEKVKVLRSTRRLTLDDAVFGQYEGYRDSDGVAPDSTTPTYAAVTAHVDNWRWQGVPFHLRTGKALADRVTEIAVTFKDPPVCFFHGAPDDCPSHGDVLYLRLQPDEGFHLEIDVKAPGSSDLRTVALHFHYADEFGDLPDAYSTLLRDVVSGDQTHFVRSDWVVASWELYEPLLDSDREPDRYAPGSWGPATANDVVAGQAWATPSAFDVTPEPDRREGPQRGGDAR